MPSSAQLTILRAAAEAAGGKRQAVRLANAQPVIRDILTVANFERLFTIE